MTEQRPRAFVLEPCRRIDVSRASKYGEILYIFERNDGRPSIWTDEFVIEAIERLKNTRYDPARDYFILAGSIVPLAKVVAALAAEYGHVRALAFSATDRDYIQQELGRCMN